jgi:diaminopimelate epimerase
MNIPYWKFDPTGNITLLAEGSFPPEERKRLADLLMQMEPDAEQVGFLSPGDSECDLSLTMTGGEFCGNASLSAAAWLLEKRQLPRGDVSLRVSGAPEPVTVSIEKQGGDWVGSLQMPPVQRISTEALPLDGQFLQLPVVWFPGICHCILTSPISRQQAKNAIRQWGRLLDTPALGLMLYHEKDHLLTPLVWVSGADTLFWENSCASGTSAVGAWLAREACSSIQRDLIQPGGTLHIEAGAPSDGSMLRLSGRVRLLKSSFLQQASSVPE